MPRMTQEERRALAEVIVEARHSNHLVTFDSLALQFRLPNRQAARMLYQQGIQFRIDDEALNCLDNDDQVNPLANLSKRVEARIRREKPHLLAGYDRRRSRDVIEGVVRSATASMTLPILDAELIRTRGDGTEQEPW